MQETIKYPWIKKNVFTVKYYQDVLNDSNAKKVKYYTRVELLPLLIVREKIDTAETGDKDGSSSERRISVESSGSNSDSDSDSDKDNIDLR